MPMEYGYEAGNCRPIAPRPAGESGVVRSQPENLGDGVGVPAAVVDGSALDLVDPRLFHSSPPPMPRLSEVLAVPGHFRRDRRRSADSGALRRAGLRGLLLRNFSVPDRRSMASMSTLGAARHTARRTLHDAVIAEHMRRRSRPRHRFRPLKTFSTPRFHVYPLDIDPPGSDAGRPPPGRRVRGHLRLRLRSRADLPRR